MVIYRGASDHIYALYLEILYQANGWQEVWQWADLTSLSGAPVPGSLLSAYARSDGISTVNYTGSSGHVHEMRLDDGWQWADLTSLTGAPAPGSVSRPIGYVRGDGINAVVYAISSVYTDTGHIYELRLDSGWQSHDLSSAGAGLGYEPVGYVRADGISAVVNKGGGVAGHIQELRLEHDGWHWADLTDLAGAPLPSHNGGWP